MRATSELIQETGEVTRRPRCLPQDKTIPQATYVEPRRRLSRYKE